MDQRQIDKALEACYDAVVDRAAWSGALHRFAQSINAACCMFYPQNPDQTLLRMPASPAFSQFLEAFIGEGWWLEDHRADRAFPLLNAGRPVLIEHEIATEDDRRTLAAYHELYFRQGLPWWACLGFSVDGRQWAVPILRSGRQGAFNLEEAKQLESTIPHLQRMISISEKLTLDRVSGSLDVLARAKVPALALDWRGRVLRMNDFADRLLGDGLTIVDGRLAASSRENNVRLQRLLAAAISSEAQSVSSRESLASTCMVRVDRRDKHPLVVEAMPAGRLFADVLFQARALVFITDLGAPMLTAPEKMAAVLGLTTAEGRLTSILADGAGLEEAAWLLGISVHTARSQIKSIFAKTNTHRQGELVALASRAARPQGR